MSSHYFHSVVDQVSKSVLGSPVLIYIDDCRGHKIDAAAFDVIEELLAAMFKSCKSVIEACLAAMYKSCKFVIEACFVIEAALSCDLKRKPAAASDDDHWFQEVPTLSCWSDMVRPPKDEVRNMVGYCDTDDWLPHALYYGLSNPILQNGNDIFLCPGELSIANLFTSKTVLDFVSSACEKPRSLVIINVNSLVHAEGNINEQAELIQKSIKEIGRDLIAITIALTNKSKGRMSDIQVFYPNSERIDIEKGRDI